MELPDSFREDVNEWRKYRANAKDALKARDSFKSNTTLDSESASEEFAKLEEKQNRTESLVHDKAMEICDFLARLYVNHPRSDL